MSRAGGFYVTSIAGETKSRVRCRVILCHMHSRGILCHVKDNSMSVQGDSMSPAGRFYVTSRGILCHVQGDSMSRAGGFYVTCRGILCHVQGDSMSCVTRID